MVNFLKYDKPYFRNGDDLVVFYENETIEKEKKRKRKGEENMKMLWSFQNVIEYLEHIIRKWKNY